MTTPAPAAIAGSDKTLVLGHVCRPGRVDGVGTHDHRLDRREGFSPEHQPVKTVNGKIMD